MAVPVTELTAADLRAQLVTLGVRPGDLLVARASLRAIGPVAGGADALLEALLGAVGPEGTLIGLAFVRSFPLPLRPEHAAVVVDQRTPSYAGALANAMVRHPRARRSRHPIQKYVAIGPLASELVDNHTAQSGAYDVLRSAAGFGGRHLKLGSDEQVPGVGTTHVAQNLLGLRQQFFRRGVMYRAEDGTARLFEANWAGGCSRGFRRLVPDYEERGAIVARGRLGAAPALLTDMAKTLAADMQVLSRDPGSCLCDDPFCYSCRVSWDFCRKTPAWFLAKYVAPSLRALRNRVRRLHR